MPTGLAFLGKAQRHRGAQHNQGMSEAAQARSPDCLPLDARLP